MNLAHRSIKREKGVVLFIALIVLVAMSLTGIALIRSVDTAVLISGNIAFRQSTRMSADTGVESAITWLASTAADKLYLNQPSGITNSTGYWAVDGTGVDLTGTASTTTSDDFNWNTAVTVGPDANGNTAQWVIHRMCAVTGDPASINCMRSGIGTASGTPAGETKYGIGVITGIAQVIYRVTVKVTGPRNTISYVQVMTI